MPIDVNRGEIANRLRRFLDIRGRIPTRLDENVVPVVQLASVDDAPWRQSPITWAGWVSQPSVALLNSFVAVTLPRADFGIFSVDRVAVDNLSGSTAASISLILNAESNTVAEGTDLGPIWQRVENLNQPLLLLPASQPVGLHQVIGASTNIIGQGVELERLRIHAAALGLTRQVFQGPYYVPAGGAIYALRLTVNETLNVHMYGRFWPDVSALPSQ